jgi:Bacterial protein of unknown function (DUF882)
MHVVRCAVALAALLVPALARAEPHSGRPMRTARVQKSETSASRIHACLKAPVEVVAGGESATIALTKCDGGPAPLAVDELSILARPGGASKPKQSLDTLARIHGPELSPGIRRLDARLVEDLQSVAEHFGRPAQATRILLVSGYRPKSAHSYHNSGRALDFRVEGVDNEALVAFCKTLPDTGCGYYPNSVFVHMDVRQPGTGHVAWIDASRPGEAPRYVRSWPPPPEGTPSLPALPLEAKEHDTSALGTATARRSAHPSFF